MRLATVRARATHASVALLVTIFLSGCGGLGADPGVPAPPAEAMSLTERTFAEEVLLLVNVEREREGVPPLVWDEAVAQVAFDHAQDMASEQYFEHVSLDGSTPGDRLADAGIDGTWWGENIAMGQPDPQAVVDDWMTSEGHRANILEPQFDRLGVGVRFGWDGPFWVQDFLSPPE
jgi:uncharacterized protein YkwD